jgi:hypothetical protein
MCRASLLLHRHLAIAQDKVKPSRFRRLQRCEITIRLSMIKSQLRRERRNKEPEAYRFAFLAAFMLDSYPS